MLTLATRCASCGNRSASLVAMKTASIRAASTKSYKLVVVGGGSGGCATAAKFSYWGYKGQVAVIEPEKMHYYQPMWTLVGGGMKTLEQSGKPMSEVLPKKADWLQDRVVEFLPKENTVVLGDGTRVSYKYLVVAMGIQLNYGAIKGLPEAFDTPGVCSNYSSNYVNKTFQALENFKEGNAIFTFPATPVKCAGAPQKIMYIADEYLRKHGKRDKANVSFMSAGAALFGVKKYANSLWELVERRDISVNLLHNLVEVRPQSKEAVFARVDKPGENVVMPYELLHVSPPMKAPSALSASGHPFVDKSGFLDVNKSTLRHMTYPNVFGIGDCTNLPTSKTAAAVAGQIGVLRRNLKQTMKNKESDAKYDGYTSCPLVTGYSKCILAEFDYNAEPLETFPINQGKESRLMFYMKKDFMPAIYWHGLLNGWWEGPKYFRKAMHFGFSK